MLHPANGSGKNAHSHPNKNLVNVAYAIYLPTFCQLLDVNPVKGMLYAVFASCITGSCRDGNSKQLDTLPQHPGYPFNETSMTPELGVDQACRGTQIIKMVLHTVV